MPIYLEDVTAPELPPHMVAALLCIGDATIGRAVTPGVGMALLRLHLIPLLAESSQPLFSGRGQPSWDRILSLHADLLHSSGGEDSDLVAAAFIAGVVWRHSTRPPRELTFEHSVDVASFLRMAAIAKLIVPSTVRLPSGIEVQLLRFCRFCWRHAPAGVCGIHAVHSNPAAVAEYKQVQRLRPSFEREVLADATREELQFHDGEFDTSVFFPSDAAQEWLRARRPLLAVSLPAERFDLGQLVHHLLGSIALEQLFFQHPHMLTPVTLRAEAWLRALQERPSWGGRRAGAGPKSKTPR
jgi:hypothetical protein